MAVRTSVAFDPATATRLERLAKRWEISKSETLRRALESAEIAAAKPSPGSSQPTLEEIAAMTHQDALEWLQSHSLVTADPHRETALRLMRPFPQAAVSSMAWWEFECGPVSPKGIAIVRITLAGGVIPFGEAHAKEAARLFNAVGRSRRFKFDSLIAATAILAHAELATVNGADFQPFVPHGLKLFDLS